MKLSEIVSVQEAAIKYIDLDALCDAIDYRLDQEEDFSMDSMEVKNGVAEYTLEDRMGHRGLSYGASVEIKGNKVHVDCEGKKGTFDLVEADEDGEALDDEKLDNLVFDILDIISQGVSDASEEDNPEDDGDEDDEDQDD